MANGSISDVQNRGDGHIYYVIGSPDSSGDFIVRVTTISERNALTGKGLCLVTEAYKGDASVTRGWALYMAIGSNTTTTGPKWIKIAEEESVDGIWGFQQEILDTLVKKPTFSSHVAANEKEHVTFRAAVAKINALDYHSHSNKDVLNGLSDRSGQLYYKNAPVGGGSYIYNKQSGITGKLKWINPTNSADTEDGLTAIAIANKFVKTTIAYNGQTLQIVEADGSISSFIIQVKDGELTPIFVGTTGGNLSDTRKTVTFVTGLPDPSAMYVSKGYWYLLPPASCGYLAGHLFECIANGDSGYIWVDVNWANSPVANVGPRITLCYKSEWNKAVITFKDPANDDTNKIYWAKTYIVRKIGSSPANKNDGIIVGVEDSYNKYDGSTGNVFTDTFPLTHDPVFYGVFSETNGGYEYTNHDECASKAVFPDWSFIKTLLSKGNAKSMFSIGDEVTLPDHKVFGSIVCKVIGISAAGNGIDLIPINSLASLPFDGVEYGKTPATGKYLSSTTYYRITEAVGNVVKFEELTAGEDYTVGSDIEEDDGVFVNPSNASAEYDSSTSKFTLHGCNAYTGSNIEMWLKSYGASATGTGGWYSPDETHAALDRLADELNMPGFLNGFLKTGYTYDTQVVTDPFLAMLTSVRLPYTSEIGESTLNVWLADAVATGLDAKTSVGFQKPETLCGVTPVINLSVMLSPGSL